MNLKKAVAGLEVLIELQYLAADIFLLEMLRENAVKEGDETVIQDLDSKLFKLRGQQEELQVKLAKMRGQVRPPRSLH